MAAAAADLPPGTPTWAVRASAVAPLPVYLGCAVGVDRLVGVSGDGPLGLVAAFLLAFWASLSAGDISVFLRAGEAVTNGRMAVSRVKRTETVSNLLTVALVVVMVVLFVR